jgi:hypothetical protein
LGVNANVQLGSQTVKFDREATAALYRDAITTAGANDCNCAYCKNFAAQRTAAYPLHFLELLELIGVDPRKELEVFDLNRVAADSTRRLYGGWFAFYGTITARADWRPEHKPEAFTYWATDSFPNAGLPDGVCAIEFLCELPWVISQPPEQSGTH